MAIDTKALNKAIREKVTYLVDIPIIIGNQKGTSPADNYVSMKLKDWQQIGKNHQSRTDNTSTSTTTVKSLWKVCCEFRIIGQDSESQAITLASRLQKTSVIDGFESIGIDYLYKNPIKHAPRLLNTGWEETYILEVYFNLVITDTDTTGYIESAEIEGTIYDEASNEIYNHTWLVDTNP